MYYVSHYFCIKDIWQQEDIELLHCPTEQIIANYFIKPLQGGLLKYTGALLIMGLVARPFPLEEQTVGKGDEKRAGKMSEVNAKMSIWGDAE